MSRCQNYVHSLRLGRVTCCLYNVDSLGLEWGDGFVYVPDTTRRIVDISSIVLDWGRVTDLSAFLIRRVTLSILRR